MSGLRNIVLHHSYYKGLRANIPCTGNTYLLGSNGAGKTNALNLIPIFYGKDPSSLVTRTADKESFLDWYLPNRQSLVVFEYERVNGDVCCAVIYRREAGQYAYRFIKGAANDTLFHPELEPLYDRGISASDLLKFELPRLEVTVSNQIINTIDYRSIIQNDPMSSGKRRRARSAAFTMLREAREFSLGGSTDKMQHIESLTAVALNKGHLLKSLKAMIVDTMIQDRVAISTPQVHHKNKDLWSDLKSLQEFAKDNTKLRLGLDAHAALQEVREKLFAHQESLGELISATRKTIRDQEVKADEVVGKITVLESNQQDDRIRLGALEAKHRGAVADLESWLEALENERSEWEDMDIEALKRRAGRRQGLESDLALAQKKLDALTSRREAIDGKFKQQRTDVENAGRAEERRLSKREQELSNAKVDLSQAAKAQASEFERQCDIEIEGLIQVSQARVKELRADIDKLHKQLNEAGQYLPSEQEKLIRSEEAVETAERELVELDLAHGAAKEAQGQAKENHENAMSALGNAEHAAQQAHRRLDHLAAQLHPDDNSLLTFLRSSDLPWHDSLGKLIDPRLLQRKDLSPQLSSGADLEQAFGLLLDLSALPRPEAAEQEDVLQAQMDHAENALRLAREDVSRCEGQAHLAQKAIKEANAKFARTESRLRQGREKDSQARASHRSLHASMEAVKAERCDTLQERIQQAQQREERHEDEAEQQRQKRRHEHERQRQQQKADYQADVQRLQADLDAVEDEKAQNESGTRAKLKELDILRDQALSKDGVDPQKLKETRQSIQSAEDELQAIKEFEPKIRTYDAWLKDRWGARAGKERQLSDSKRFLEEVMREGRASEDRFREQRNNLVEAKQSAEQEAKALKKDVETWDILSTHAAGLCRDIPHVPGGSAATGDDTIIVSSNADQLVSELRRLVSLASDQKQEVHKVANLCNSLLGKHPESMISQDWNNLREHRRAISRYDEGSSPFNIEVMQDLEVLLDDKLPHIERAIIENVHSIGSVLSDHHGDLRNLNSVVEQVSGVLHRNLNTQHTFSVISDVSVKVRSKIHELGFWNELAAFGEVWSKWMTSGFNELPSEDLLSRMMLLEDQLQHARMNTDDLQSMVDLEIEFYEQGRRVPIRSDADLGDSSSVGISRLAILVLFSALTRYLCPNENINITWPIDELGQLAPENIVKLFRMMRDRNISLFCAEPKLSYELQNHFAHRVALSKSEGVRTMEPDSLTSKNNPLLAKLAGAMPAQQPTHEAITQGGDQ